MRTRRLRRTGSSQSWYGARVPKDGVTDIYVAASHDGGRTFGAPTRVNQVAGDAQLLRRAAAAGCAGSAVRTRSSDRRGVDREGCGRHAAAVGAFR